MSLHVDIPINITYHVKSTLVDLLKLIYPDVWTYIDTLDLDYNSKENTLINECKDQCVTILRDVIYLSKVYKSVYDIYFKNNPGIPSYSPYSDCISKFEYNTDIDFMDLSDYVSNVFDVNPNSINMDLISNIINYKLKIIIDEFLNYDYNIIYIEHVSNNGYIEFILTIGDDIRDYRLKEVRNILENDLINQY